MSQAPDAPDPLPWSEVKSLRGDLRRPMRLPQDYPSIEAYHDAKDARRRPAPQTHAELGYPHLKGR